MSANSRLAHGRVVGDVWCKSCHASRHFLRRPRAISFDVDDLAAAEARGARYVAVDDIETGTTWETSLATIRQRGLPVNRGHGAQVALELKHFGRRGQSDNAALQLVFWT